MQNKWRTCTDALLDPPKKKAKEEEKLVHRTVHTPLHQGRPALRWPFAVREWWLVPCRDGEERAFFRDGKSHCQHDQEETCGVTQTDAFDSREEAVQHILSKQRFEDLIC